MILQLRENGIEIGEGAQSITDSALLMEVRDLLENEKPEQNSKLFFCGSC